MKNETDMKRTYKTPAMKVRKISHVRMLCTTDGELNFGNSYYSGNNDYIEGDLGSGYGYGVPD